MERYRASRHAESPNILVVEGNPDMENIMAEVEKDEPRAKRTGSLNITGEKTNQIHLPVKRLKRAGHKQILLL